jgi:hypothetical protein
LPAPPIATTASTRQRDLASLSQPCKRVR